MMPTFPPSPLKTAALCLYLVFYALFAFFAIETPISQPQNWALVFLSAFSGACVAIFWVWSYSQTQSDDASLRALIGGGVVTDIAFHFAATRPSVSALLVAVLTCAGNLALLTAAIGVGLLVGRGLQKPNYLVMAAIVGALTDIFSVYAGPSSHIIGSGSFQYVSFHWGMVGEGGVQPIVGAGDFIFLALYFFGARKFGLDHRKTLLAMIAAIGVGFFSTLWVGAIPALPFMSLALLLVHGRELKQQSGLIEMPQ